MSYLRTCILFIFSKTIIIFGSNKKYSIIFFLFFCPLIHLSKCHTYYLLAAAECRQMWSWRWAGAAVYKWGRWFEIPTFWELLNASFSQIAQKCKKKCTKKTLPLFMSPLTFQMATSPLKMGDLFCIQGHKMTLSNFFCFIFEIAFPFSLADLLVL